MRVGIGYDIHRFNGAGKRPLKLGGVTIPRARGLSGHSDADVLLHAIADALLGAIGAPDLGELFPSGDPRSQGMDSRIFVSEALRRVHRAGWRVGNVDTTVIADEPRLTPHKATLRASIGGLLEIASSAVSVKGKTTEGLSPGKRGIAAQAVVLLKRARGSGVRVRGRSAPSPQPRARSRR